MDPLEKNGGQKCSTDQRFIFIEVTFYKIHILASSLLPPTKLPPYDVHHCDFNVTVKSHRQARIQKILNHQRIPIAIYHKYAFTTAYFCIMKQKKMKHTNETQMLNRKSTNTPLLLFIFACTLTLKSVFREFLETQLRSRKCVFVQVNNYEIIVNFFQISHNLT